ncbi:hypothetical protein JDV02_002969 [Purpureocillium takamizusanense]|uniref:Uncharacterized protein n=1 Tax=Purpureocillium takamizusanense TaxID=2060973 RepID=A0A9Q8QC11_9HYPO|nr:uncharacterized protein JDV02_002969 [Purpureocillium takamizusanense]UNI16543.1 hypothetical protein JDV02_002969 [Purpureocillium takamizusanense]
MASPRLPPWVPDWLEAAFASPRAHHNDDGAHHSLPTESSPPVVPTIELTQTPPSSSSSPSLDPTFLSTAASPGIGGADDGIAQCHAAGPHVSSHVFNVDGMSLRGASRDASTLDDSANTESTYVTNQLSVRRREKNVIVTPKPDRVVHRKLRGIHLSVRPSSSQSAVYKHETRPVMLSGSSYPDLHGGDVPSR